MKDYNIEGNRIVHCVVINGRTYIVEELIEKNEALKFRNENQECHINHLQRDNNDLKNENSKLKKELTYSNIAHNRFQQYKKAYRDLCNDIYVLEDHIESKIKELVDNEYLDDEMGKNLKEISTLTQLLSYIENNFCDLEDI